MYSNLPRSIETSRRDENCRHGLFAPGNCCRMNVSLEWLESQSGQGIFCHPPSSLRPSAGLQNYALPFRTFQSLQGDITKTRLSWHLPNVIFLISAKKVFRLEKKDHAQLWITLGVLICKNHVAKPLEMCDSNLWSFLWLILSKNFIDAFDHTFCYRNDSYFFGLKSLNLFLSLVKFSLHKICT